MIDLCCGLGGISHAARELGCRIVAGVDTSATALASFEHNFAGAQAIQGSVTRRSTLEACREAMQSDSPSVRTLVVSGPPCQGFSAAGPRAKRDPRNRVLMAVARAIVALSPDAAIVENVATLMGPTHKRSLSRFRRILDDGGYSVVVLRLNAADFGVPQIRQRMICFASREPLRESAIRSSLESLKRPCPTVRVAFAGLTRPATYRGPKVHIKTKVPNHIGMRHSLIVRTKIAKILPGKGPMSYRRLHPDRPARTLISGHRAPPAHYSQARSITPREAARLQGFPDTFEVKGTFANQMLHVTNAVPPPLALAAIAAFLNARRAANA
ncbi:MAG: DNA cytosine methyltransferase [Fimbriimonadaceae bacterium]|nr:DNA cytosine methyltransferase [Fimbriimonadaceae bacterium]